MLHVVDEYAAAIVEMCEFSGGAVVEPVARHRGVADYEDNLIMSLANDDGVDAMTIVTRDADLLLPGRAWNGRPIMRPHEFVHRVIA